MTYSEILKYARELRKNQTKAEEFFWDKVRNRRFLGLKFNRQFVIEVTKARYFIVDFHCAEKRLIVELDGGIHDFQMDYDRGREYELQELGYKIIRFSNEEVFEDWKTVENRLSEVLGM
ncbi:MAG: endonuclease domain-containing protein [Marinoscillum sp.]